MTRAHLCALNLLGLILIAGSFLAGYMLMARETAAPVTPAVIVAAAQPPAPAGPRLVIKKALYGDLPDGAAADVTAKLADLVASDSLTVAASNDSFGDPAQNIVKKLRVDYTIDNVPHSQTVGENETISIIVKPGPTRLIIKKALYGDLPDGASADVTAKVAQAADNDSLSIAASNDKFGDPAENIVKKLRVDYTFDGRERSKTVGEGETFTISNAGE